MRILYELVKMNASKWSRKTILCDHPDSACPYSYVYLCTNACGPKYSKAIWNDRLEGRSTPKIIDWEKRLSSARTPDEWKQQLKVQIQIANYYLDKDVDPNSPNAVTFTREFVKMPSLYSFRWSSWSFLQISYHPSILRGLLNYCWQDRSGDGKSYWAN